MAQQETLLHKMVHQSLIDLKDAKTAIEELQRSKTIQGSAEDKELLSIAFQCVSAGMAKMLKLRDDVARVRNKTNLNLGEEINSILDAFNPETKKYGIKITRDVDVSVSYYMDKRDLKSVITNLVTNSIKALRDKEIEDKKIIVRLIEKPRFLVIIVKDNGVGIAEHIREKIFDPFFTTTERYGGFGLGLSIIDDVLDDYNSHLELVDDGEPGACFMVKLKR